MCLFVCFLFFWGGRDTSLYHRGVCFCLGGGNLWTGCLVVCLFVCLLVCLFVCLFVRSKHQNHKTSRWFRHSLQFAIQTFQGSPDLHEKKTHPRISQIRCLVGWVGLWPGGNAYAAYPVGNACVKKRDRNETDCLLGCAKIKSSIRSGLLKILLSMGFSVLTPSSHLPDSWSHRYGVWQHIQNPRRPFLWGPYSISVAAVDGCMFFTGFRTHLHIHHRVFRFNHGFVQLLLLTDVQHNIFRPFNAMELNRYDVAWGVCKNNPFQTNH